MSQGTCLFILRSARLDDPPSRHGGKPCVWSHENLHFAFCFPSSFHRKHQLQWRKKAKKDIEVWPNLRKIGGFQRFAAETAEKSQVRSFLSMWTKSEALQGFSEMPRFGPWPFFGPKICNPGIFPQ